MARLRYNNQGGALGAALSASTPGTSQAIIGLFAVAPNFATLAAGDYIPLVFDAGTGTFECAHLTVYNPASPLDGTVTRAAEDAALWPAVAHSAGTGTWACDPTKDDFGPTKRATEVFSDTNYGLAITGWSDDCTRSGFMMPVAPTRCRLRIRNISTFSGAVSQAQVSNITYVGTTATVTANNHGLSNGQSTTLSSILSTHAGIGPYLDALVNGLTFVVGSVTTNTFQITLSATPTDAWSTFFNIPVCTNPQPISFTGVWWGTPNVAAESTWLGDFTAAPAQVLSAFTVDPSATGAEYVSAWFTPPASAATPYTPQGISLGYTTPAGANVFVGNNGLSWHSATNVGCATAASAAGIPGVGSLSPNTPFDIRMEYDFVGNNQIGLFLSTSLGDGTIIPTNGKNTFGLQGPENCWPKKAGLHLGHAIINGAIGGAGTTQFTNPANWPTARFDLATTVPDYAVIDLVYNDAGGNLSLATYQTNVLQIVANLKALGINRIYICTGWGGGGYNSFGPGSWAQGALNANVTAGSKSSIVLQNPGGTLVTQGLPGGGWPGSTQDWTNAASGVAGTCTPFYIGTPESGTSEGPFTPGAATATATSGTFTLSAFGTNPVLANFHYAGEPVLGVYEYQRRLYNQWMRQGVPGVAACFDLDELAWGTVREPRTLHGDFFSNANTGPHPSNPGLYVKMAQTFAAGLAGV